MAFRLTSSNGAATHVSLAAAKTADAAFAGALTWTIDQAGDGGTVVISAMSFTSLLITVASGIRHTGVKVTNLSTVGHTTGSIRVQKANVTIEWLVVDGPDNATEISFLNGAASGGIVQNVLWQGGSFGGIEHVGAVPITATFINCGIFDTAAISCYATNSGVTATLTLKHCSASGASQPMSAASSALGSATVNATNCVLLGGILEDQLTGTATFNTTNCVYPPGGREIAGYPIVNGADIAPQLSSVALEFVSAADPYSIKNLARRNKAGTAAGVSTDVRGASYSTPPSIGFSAVTPMTKLYLTSVLEATIPGAEQSANAANVTWANAADSYRMRTTPDVGQVSIGGTSLNNTSQQKHFITKWVSTTLNLARTVGGGTVTFNCAAREANLNANFWPNMICIYVLNPITNIVRGYVTDPTASQGGAEPGAALSTRVIHFTFASSAVAAQAGDIIVAEVWSDITQAAATAYALTFFYGGTVENTTPNAIVTDHASYLELAEDISFGPAGGKGMFSGMIGSGIY